MMRAVKYRAYLGDADGDEIFIGEFARLSSALVKARIEQWKRGPRWDWYVHRYVDGQLISRRSSVGGFEVLT